jgi:hypothetical protein
LYSGVEVSIDPELASELEGLPRIGPQELGDDLVGDLSLDLFVDGREQIFFPSEVVIQGTLGNTSLGNHLVE